MIQTYCEQKGFDKNEYRFQHNNVEFKGESTPIELNMVHGDRIDIIKKKVLKREVSDESSETSETSEYVSETEGESESESETESSSKTEKSSEPYMPISFENIPEIGRNAPFNRKGRKISKAGICQSFL